ILRRSADHGPRAAALPLRPSSLQGLMLEPRGDRVEVLGAEGSYPRTSGRFSGGRKMPDGREESFGRTLSASLSMRVCSASNPGRRIETAERGSDSFLMTRGPEGVKLA